MASQILNLNPNPSTQTQTKIATELKFECRTLMDHDTILLDRLVKCVDAAMQNVNEAVSKFGTLTFYEIRDLVIRGLRELIGDKDTRFYFDDVVEGRKVYDNPAIYRVVDAVDELIVEVADGIEAHFNVYADYVFASRNSGDVVLYYKINGIELDSIYVEVDDQ
jgi:hypothetical protein